MVLRLSPDNAERDDEGKTREQTVDTPQQNGTETLSIHVDFTADSSPDPELSTYYI